MRIERYIPADILKPFIKTFMIIESEDERVNRILPDTSIVMAFRYKGSITYTEEGIKNQLPLSVITGLRKSSRLLDYAKDTATLLVIFKEAGGTAFFKEPLHALFGKSISLDHLLHPCKVAQIEEQLSETKHDLQRVAIVEQFLLSALKLPQSDRLIAHAIQCIKSANGNIKIKDMVKSMPISRDPFEKRFRRLTGTSPKQFSAIVRWRNLIANYSQPKSLTATALAAGYFDQAHFIKDFKAFTGQTPKAFFKNSSYW